MESRQKSWYVQRAITRKIIRDGTGLRPDRMTLPACWERARDNAFVVCNHVLEGNVADPVMARAAIDLLDLLAEIQMRGAQYVFPV